MAGHASKRRVLPAKASPRATVAGANRSVRAAPRSRVSPKARARTTRIPR